MEEEEQKKMSLLPTIPTKSPWSSQTYLKSVQEAPYRALVGIAIDERVTARHPEHPRFRIRNRTGLTNRWRLPQPLYSDMLGTTQALKAINMPFDQALISTLSATNPTMNPMLLTCQDFVDINEHNWSLLKKSKVFKHTTEEEDDENRLPPI